VLIGRPIQIPKHIRLCYPKQSGSVCQIYKNWIAERLIWKTWIKHIVDHEYKNFYDATEQIQQEMEIEYMTERIYLFWVDGAIGV